MFHPTPFTVSNVLEFFNLGSAQRKPVCNICRMKIGEIIFELLVIHLCSSPVKVCHCFDEIFPHSHPHVTTVRTMTGMLNPCIVPVPPIFYTHTTVEATDTIRIPCRRNLQEYYISVLLIKIRSDSMY